MRTVLGMTETALREFPAGRPLISTTSRLDDIASKVTRACASVAAAIREVLDDRFWE
jgi:hypothetical protein